MNKEKASMESVFFFKERLQHVMIRLQRKVTDTYSTVIPIS
jgi:hypothetical protein